MRTQQLRYLGAGLAFLVAALHLFHPDWGFVTLVLILTFDNPLYHLLYDPRPVAFVVSALAIIIGINLVLVGFPRKPIYLLGMLLLATYFIGYFAWHLTGHGGFLPGREPHYHGLHPIEAVIAHMQENVWARVTKLAEALLFCVLAVLSRIMMIFIEYEVVDGVTFLFHSSVISVLLSRLNVT